jgi:predicted nucleic acid-binding Zn ribbon protein
MKSRLPRRTILAPRQLTTAGRPWRHSLQDLETLIAFVNLRPQDPSEFEEAVARFAARSAAGTVKLNSPSSIALLKALTGTALNAPLRFADIVLSDPKGPSWKNRNAQKRVSSLVLALRQGAFRILDRLVRANAVMVNGEPRPELDPKTKRIDFIVNGRSPIDILPLDSTPQFQLPVVYDIQDALFAKIRNLIDRTHRPVRLRWHDGSIVPYWPLAHCLVCGKFFFKSRTNRMTCTRRCALRWDHKRRQRTVMDVRTDGYLKQHNLKVTIEVPKTST